MLTAAGRVVRDQVGADDHLCIKQIAGDSAIGGTGEALRPTFGKELQPLIDAIGIASMLTIKFFSLSSLISQPLPALISNTGPGILSED